MTTARNENTGAGADAAGPDRPRRVQLSCARGFRLPSNTVKVDRSTRWGNPYNTRFNPHRSIGRLALNMAADVEWFRLMLLHDGRWVRPPSPRLAGTETTIEDVKLLLAGRNLACWCEPDRPCHADVLLELANGWPCPTRLPTRLVTGPAVEAAVAAMKRTGKP